MSDSDSYITIDLVNLDAETIAVYEDNGLFIPSNQSKIHQDLRFKVSGNMDNGSSWTVDKDLTDGVLDVEE